MSSKTKSDFLHSFSFRLTLWYASLFTISLLIIFLISEKVFVADLVHVVDRGLLAQTAKVDQEFELEPLDQIKTLIRESIEAEGKNRIFYRLLSSNLNVVVTSDPLKWPCLNFPQMSQWANLAAGNNTIYRTLSPPDRKYKIRIISRGIDNGQYIIQIGKTMQDEEELVTVYQKVFGGAVIVLLLCGILLAWLEAQRALVRIEQLMHGLKEVTDNIAHDLRTPITRIRGIAETALGEKNAGNDQETMGIIVEECDRLVAMINTMLEIAEADAGLRQAQCTEVNMVDLVLQGCEIFTPLAQDKGLELDVIATQQPLLVLAQASQLQRVIANLLDNAIKFNSSPGRIVVEIKQKDNRALLTVQDTGIGISSDQQAKIFEKFYRVESSRSLPGNGLGLSYVKSIVTSLGGTVDLESLPGRGSQFILQIPLIQ